MAKCSVLAYCKCSIPGLQTDRDGPVSCQQHQLGTPHWSAGKLAEAPVAWDDAARLAREYLQCHKAVLAFGEQRRSGQGGDIGEGGAICKMARICKSECNQPGR